MIQAFMHNAQDVKDGRIKHLDTVMRRMRQGTRHAREKAFAEFYDLVVNAVYSHALSVLRDAQEAENVAQNTMVSCWKGCVDYDPAKGSVMTWTMTRARSRTLDRLRVIGRHQRIDIQAIEHADPASVEDPDTALSVDMQQMLLQLPERERRILFMAYFTQMTHAEIALELDMPEGTVKSVLYGALRTLRTITEEGDWQ